MGGAYFLQFLDKFILGQAAILGLREDLVCDAGPIEWNTRANQPRTCADQSLDGRRLSFTLDILPGAGRVRISS